MTVFNEIIHPVALEILTAHGLNHFEALWQLKAETVEQGNIGRGGWSRVEKIVLVDQGITHTFYIKKQQNYSVRMLGSFFRKVPTLLKEQSMIRRFQIAGIPTLETAYFGWRKVGNDQQAILITWELKDYLPLDACLANWNGFAFEQKRNISRSVAQAICHMHQQKYMHNCLYPKHIFVKLEDLTVLTALIDLEKSKWVPCQKMIIKRDLDSLNRRSMTASTKTKLYFMRDYMNERKLSANSRRYIMQLATAAKYRLSNKS